MDDIILMQLALGISSPKDVRLDKKQKKIDIDIDFLEGSKFSL